MHVVSGDIMMGKNANVGSTVGVLSGVGSQEDLDAADHIIDRYVDVDLIYYHGLLLWNCSVVLSIGSIWLLKKKAYGIKVTRYVCC